MFALRFSRFLTFVLVATSCLGGTSRVWSQEPPTYPDDPTKEALTAYQDALTRWGGENATTSDEFWKKTSEGFYRSTKALLALELNAQERLEYNAQFAGVLANFALEEGTSGKLGARFDELSLETAKALEARRLKDDEESNAILLAYARQFFGVRLRLALKKSGEAQENDFVALVGDAITFALNAPDFGEDANNIVTTIRTYAPELGEEALDAMCDAFEASGKPALIKPIQKTAGLRRFARLPGGELYFDALLLDGDEFTKKFDWEEYKGKVLLVEVWATWCGPCRKEIPRLKEVYDRYRDAGFEIVGYSIDQDVDRLKSFLVENEIPWAVASQRRSVEAGYKGLYEYYSINGVPEMILIDRDGKVTMTDARGVKLSKALEKLFPNVEPLNWDPATDFSQRLSEQGNK